MSINAIPNEVFYDPDSWIDLAPDIDWAELVPAPAPEPDPEPDPEPEEPTAPEEGGGDA